MTECKIDPSHEVDYYGCIDCFMNECNKRMWEEITKNEPEGYWNNEV